MRTTFSIALLASLALQPLALCQDAEDAEEADQNEASPGDGIDYEAHIKPILEKSCLKCHRATYKDDRGRTRKPKGDLRLDGKAWILLGGEEGNAVVPGSPAKSALYGRITLDPDDSDFMPNKGDPLTASETELIRRWIADGADFGHWTGTAGPEPEVSVPGDDAESTSEIWIFLSGKYDADEDGRISPEEYDRGREKFAQLDGNGDGFLSAIDFETSGRDERGGRGGRGGEGRGGEGRGGRGMQSSMMATMFLTRYFGGDDGELDLQELSAIVTDSDADEDGALSREESGLDSGGGRQGRGGRSMDRFLIMLSVIDTDDDELLSLAELEAFFRSVDTNEDGRLSGDEIPMPPGRDRQGGRDREGRGGSEGRGDRGGAPRGSSQATEGETAPDFTLESLTGGKPVTLSSFAGQTPVGLIFGSYT